MIITSFRVGSIFEIKDLATPVITRIATEMRDLTAVADRLKTVIASIGQGMNTGGLQAGLAAASTEVSSLSRRMTTGTRNADAYALALDRATLAANNLAAAAATASAAAGARLPRIPGAGGGVGGGGGGGGRHGPGHFFGRIGGSAPVYGGHVHASAPSSGGLIAGGISAYAVWKAMHASEELQDQQDKMRRQGRSEDEIQSITQQAFDDITRQVPTATAADVLKSTAELTFTKGNFASAVDSTAQALKIDALISNATGTKVEGQGFKMYRALEEKLVTQDKAHTDRLLGIMAQGTIATGGRVSGSDWFTFAKRAGVSWIHQSDEFVGTIVPTLIQSLGADTAGTALMTMYQTLMGAGTLSKQQYEAFDKLGLIDPDKVTHDKGGRVNVRPGGIIGSLESQGNLAKWGRDFLAPALQRVPEDQRESYIAKIGRNRNTTRMFETFSNPAGIAQFDKDAALIRKAWGVDESYKTFIGRDPKGAGEAFSKQFVNMLEALGGPAMTAAIPAIHALTTMFNTIASAANAHQNATGVVTSIGAGAGAGALLGFGIGWLGGPIGAGAGALIGAGIGGAYGIFTSPSSAVGSADERAKQKAARSLSAGWFMGPGHGASAPGLGASSSIWDSVGVGTASAATPSARTVNANITVKAETDEPHALAEKIAELLTKYLSIASMHNLGPADGVNSSSYLSGLGTP